MAMYDIKFSKKLADVASNLIAVEPDNPESRRVSIYLSRLSMEIALKAFLEKAGKPVREIRKCNHCFVKLLSAIDLCTIRPKDSIGGRENYASELRNIEIPLVNMAGYFIPLGMIIDVENIKENRASAYPDKIRYGENVKDIPPETLCLAASKLVCWVENNLDSVKYAPQEDMEKEIFIDSIISHWSEDIFWRSALDKYYELRDSGNKTITLNIDNIEAYLFCDKTPAYKLMNAMRSVYELEGYDGHRGAPRLILALLSNLSDVSETSD